MKAASKEGVESAIAEFIDRTNNAALATGVCAVCAREIGVKDMAIHRLDSIPNHHHLTPTERHPCHHIFNGMLLHPHGVNSDEDANMCLDCTRALNADKTPMFTLANGLWIGDIPHELEVLTLLERILIAKFFPAAYIIKLYPKKTGACRWDNCQMYSRLRGNVLAATIGITFIGPKNLPEKTLPNMFKSVLEWLKENNPLYEDITISMSRLGQLPEDNIPYELLARAKCLTDVTTLYAEQEGYVPSQEVIDENDEGGK
ncbi:hypothetical protein BYT27DRAFT_7228034 [Phlegmacium glaucopus]|nr:hypothetical protein BYT27DRAFT_7228034 [Phlegmacium glaucopus]